MGLNEGVLGLDAIIGDGFAVTAMACCGDEYIADSLTAAKVNWRSGSVDPESWSNDGLSVMAVLRDPVHWYRDYILNVSEGLGEFREIDEEILPVFQHLGKEPEVALNVAVINLTTLHPGWLGVQFKMYELAFIGMKDSVEWVDHDWLSERLQPFVESATNQTYDWSKTPKIQDYVSEGSQPELFEQAKQDVIREEQSCYLSYGRMMKWS